MKLQQAVLLLAWTTGQCLCQSTARTSPIDSGALNSEYAGLSQTIYIRHGDAGSVRLHIADPELVGATEARMQGILRDATITILASSEPTEPVIVDALKAIQGDLWFGDPGMTNTPFAHLFKLNGRECLAIGYVILEGGYAIPDSKAFLDFFVKEDGGWARRASTGADFAGTTFMISTIPAGLSGEAWLVAWGTTIGDTGARAKIRLYGFDGEHVRTVWKRDGLTRGEVVVSPDSVTVDYDKDYRPLENVERIHETLHVTPNGLQ